MPIEGWRSLLETKWAGCVILHNLPFGFTEIHEAKAPPAPSLPEPIPVSFTSIYEMQKSAAKWDYHDFKA